MDFFTIWGDGMGLRKIIFLVLTSYSFFSRMKESGPEEILSICEALEEKDYESMYQNLSSFQGADPGGVP